MPKLRGLQIAPRYKLPLPGVSFHLLVKMLGYALHDSGSNSCLFKYLNSESQWHARLGIRSIKNVCRCYFCIQEIPNIYIFLIIQLYKWIPNHSNNQKSISSKIGR